MYRDYSRLAAAMFGGQYAPHMPESTCYQFPFTSSTLAEPRFAAENPSESSLGFGTGAGVTSDGLERNDGNMLEELAGSLENPSYTMDSAAFSPRANALTTSASSILGATPPWSTSVGSSGDTSHQNNSDCSPLSPYKRSCDGNIAQQPCPGPEKTCNALALRVLRNMHVVADECLSTTDDDDGHGRGQQQGPPRHQAWATGTVLSQLDDGLAGATSILGCGRCCMRPQLQLLLATILNMMVQWCGAVIVGRSNTATAADAGTAVPDPPRGRIGELVIDPQPVTIGAYKLNRGLEEQVVAHLVLGKLQSVEGLLAWLLARMEESNMAVGSYNVSNPEPSSLREVGLLEIIRERAADCLNCQIGVVRGDAIRLQRDSTSRL